MDIPLLGIGTVVHNTKAAVFTALKEAFKIGYRHIDTATNYGSTKEVKSFITTTEIPRSDFWVTIKLSSPINSEDGLKKIIESFGLTYADLVMFHFTCGSPKEWKILRNCREKGLLRHIGASNCYNLDKLPRDTYAVQIELHPFAPETDFISKCIERNIKVIGYAPMATGAVQMLELATPKKIKSIMEKYGYERVSEVYLAWNIQRLRGHGAILTGSSNPDNLHRNFSILTKADISKNDIKTLGCLNKLIFDDGIMRYTLANPAKDHRRQVQEKCDDQQMEEGLHEQLNVYFQEVIEYPYPLDLD